MGLKRSPEQTARATPVGEPAAGAMVGLGILGGVGSCVTD